MSTGTPREGHSRRTVITATATAAALAAIHSTISACGRPGTGSTPVVDPGPTSGAPASGDVCARAIAQTGDIPVGGGKVYPDVPVIVTQPSAGEFRGFGIVCTHDGCELNSVSDGTINCPCHGSRFTITDGSPVHGPARTGLRQEKIAVNGTCIVLV
jgi:Rieske Fe-S protein